MFSDQKTTVDEMRAACIALVKRKGWGDGNGVQNPQHVAMAMTVEMSEVLEHFQWLSEADIRALMEGGDEERRAEIAEEMADVLIYMLQLSYALKVDLAANVERKLGIVEKRKYNENTEK